MCEACAGERRKFDGRVRGPSPRRYFDSIGAGEARWDEACAGERRKFNKEGAQRHCAGLRLAHVPNAPQNTKYCSAPRGVGSGEATAS